MVSPASSIVAVHPLAHPADPEGKTIPRARSRRGNCRGEEVGAAYRPLQFCTLSPGPGFGDKRVPPDDRFHDRPNETGDLLCGAGTG
jgi:hypothetical protein